MSVEVSVADVRAALARSAQDDVAGSGEAATLLLGRVFHEVFSDLVSSDANKSGLRVIVEAAEEPELRKAALLEHTWRQLIAPRLRRHAAALQTSSEQVLMFWRAAGHLAHWLAAVVSEVALQSAYPRGSWPDLAGLLRSEVPLTCELREAGWKDSVRLIGIADGIVNIPRTSSYCAIELKLGRCAPVIDLGQAALYHLMLRREGHPTANSALALLRFSPELDERLIEASAVATAEARLLELIAEIAGVKPGSPESTRRRRHAHGAAASKAESEPRKTAAAGTSESISKKSIRGVADEARRNGAQPPTAAVAGAVPASSGPPAPPARPGAAGTPATAAAVSDPRPVIPPPVTPHVEAATSTPEADAAARYDELSKRLVRACREQGTGIELRDIPIAGPRFLRFMIRLTPGTRLDALKRRTPEIQLRLELRAEPLVTQESGRLYIDIERPDPETVTFESITSQLPELDPMAGSAKVPIGVDASGKLHFADLSSSGRSHMLAAGTTGSGKSEWLRMMLAGLIASNTPDTLRVVTLDPKLAAFGDLERSRFLWQRSSWWIPGGERPASELFQDLVEEMDRRYQLTRTTGTDNLRDHILASGKPLARIVCVCDEYYALISQSREERGQIEEPVALLGAKARAAGIHLVLATQQPSRAVISGIIQSNLPCRVALALSSHIESNMILGTRGAERLTGKGDLLYKDLSDPVRLQAPYLSADERARRLKV